MPIQQIDPKAAWELLNQTSGSILIDVRTEEEFNDGHPAMAKNIPISRVDERSGQMLPNADFATIVAHHVPKTSTVVLSCRSGQRSMMAAMVLENAGYDKLLNVKGGFAGNAATEGWQDSGLPVSQDTAPGADYETLRKAAGK